MPETVLRGPDGGPAIDEITGQPLTIEEMLRRRGILAVGGNSSPLHQQSSVGSAGDDALVDAVAASNSSAGVVPGAGATVAPTVAASTQPIARGGPVAAQVAADPNMTATNTPEEQSNLLEYLLGAGLISAAAYALAKSKLGRSNPASLMNAASVEDISNLPARSNIVDAEFYPVTDEAGPNRLAGAVAQRELSKPSNRLPTPNRLIPDYSGPAPATRQQVGARQSVQSRQQLPGNDPIHLNDAYSDIPEEDLRHAVAIRDMIMRDRIAGRKQLSNRGSLTQRRASKPTADINPEGVLNEIIAIMRRNPSALGALRRGVR